LLMPRSSRNGAAVAVSCALAAGSFAGMAAPLRVRASSGPAD
jgi:hypothetical protein